MDLDGKNNSEVWSSLLESATKAQLNIGFITGGLDSLAAIGIGYVPIVHIDRRRDGFWNLIVDNFNFGASIPFTIGKDMNTIGWGMGLGILTTKDNKSALQWGMIFPNETINSKKSIFYLGFDFPTVFNLAKEWAK